MNFHSPDWLKSASKRKMSAGITIGYVFCALVALYLLMQLTAFTARQAEKAVEGTHLDWSMKYGSLRPDYKAGDRCYACHKPPSGKEKR